MEAWLQKNRGYLALSLGWGLLLGGVLLWRPPAPAPIRIVEPTPRPTRTPALLVVYVSGAVAHPDVYTLAENSRLKDALLAAGGARPDADVSALNLAMPLHDGQEVHVPAQGEVPAPASVAAPPGVTAPPGVATPLNVNTAAAAELEALPGIGPVLAQRIVEDREANGPYASLEQLARVRGIGPALLDKLRGLVVFQ